MVVFKTDIQQVSMSLKLFFFVAEAQKKNSVHLLSNAILNFKLHFVVLLDNFPSLLTIITFNFSQKLEIVDEKKGSIACAGNTKGGNITVPLTSCLTGLK